LALGIVNGGFAQTNGNNSSTDGAAPQTEWHQKVLKRAQSNVSQSAEEIPAAVNRTTKQSSSGQWRDANAATTVEPRAAGRQRVVRTAAEESEVIEPGTVQYEPLGSEGGHSGKHTPMIADQYEGDVEGNDCDACGACGPHTDAFGYECFDGCLHLRWLRDFTLSVGAQGFKGPRDLDQNGNFGFHEGVGLSGPLGDPWNIGYQIGANFEQSDLSGTPATSTVHATDRKQTFVTVGLFRRAECCGWQGGIAYDFQHDTYDEKIDLQQLRFEISYLCGNQCELGFYGASAVDSSRLDDGTKVTATNMYALFGRRYFENGGDGRIFGGLTDQGDGLFGADLWLPLGKSFAVQSGATYVLPKEGRHDMTDMTQPSPHESWGLSMSLVWYPGRCALGQQHNPYRPLFTTADNTTFMTERVSH
jgi:hypothetical protein